MAKAEKLCRRGTGAKTRRFIKRRTARLRRRAARLDPEAAGTRLRDFTRGWSD